MSTFEYCLECCSYSIVLLVGLTATLGLSITSVVIGATNLYSNCTGYSQIPEYLITSGVLGIVAFILRCSDNLLKKSEEKEEDSCFSQLIYLAHFGVVNWGSVILFGKDTPDCDTVMFNYALAINLTTYAILILYIIFYCCSCCIVLCESSSKEKPTQQVGIQMQNTNQTEV